jgi:hypothetical protein
VENAATYLGSARYRRDVWGAHRLRIAPRTTRM